MVGTSDPSGQSSVHVTRPPCHGFRFGGRWAGAAESGDVRLEQVEHDALNADAIRCCVEQLEHVRCERPVFSGVLLVFRREPGGLASALAGVVGPPPPVEAKEHGAEQH